MEVLAHPEGTTETIFHTLDEDAALESLLHHHKPESVKDVKLHIEKFCGDFVRDRSLFQILDGILERGGIVLQDLAGARSFNISPSVVRTPEKHS